MWRKLLALLLVAVIGVTAFYVLYHPPMRLMPPPLLFQAGGDRVFDVAPELTEGSRIEIFYGTNRLPLGPESRRLYMVAPDRSLRVGTATLRIGEDTTPIDQIREWTTGMAGGERPFLHLEALREAAVLDPGAPPRPGSPAAAWFVAIDAALAESRVNDILIYIHGANTTLERAAGQASQLRHFSGRNAVVVLFTWPTAENFLRYGRDIDNAFASAPHLAELIQTLLLNTDVRNIDVMTYSAGATVGSAGLALLAGEDPIAAGRIDTVYHAAPDADFRGFVDDLKVYGPAAGQVVTAANLGDSALRLAAAVNRASRAGRPDLRELDAEAAGWLLDASDAQALELLHIRPDEMPDLAATSHTFWYDDPWVSNDVLLALMLGLGAEARALEPGEAATGARYWTFPADYPERLRARLTELTP